MKLDPRIILKLFLKFIDFGTQYSYKLYFHKKECTMLTGESLKRFQKPFEISSNFHQLALYTLFSQKGKTLYNTITFQPRLPLASKTLSCIW